MTTFGKSILLATLCVLLLASSTPPAAALGGCYAVAGSCAFYSCQAGETMQLVVRGVGSGTIQGCGLTAGCTPAGDKCVATLPVVAGGPSWVTCIGEGAVLVECSSV